MKRLVTIAALVLTVGLASPAPGGTRILEKEIPVGEATTLVLDTAVGDVDVSATDTGTLRVTVELRARKGKLFGSRRAGDEQVERTELSVERSGSRLFLELDWPGGDPLFEARWTLELPRSMDLDLDLGVGDVRVEGLAGDLGVDSGVGDVTVAGARGDIEVDLGVGEVKISAPAGAFGKVACSTGVGDCRLETGGQTLRGEGMISKDLHWHGDGPSRIDVDTGVGSVTVVLTE